MTEVSISGFEIRTILAPPTIFSIVSNQSTVMNKLSVHSNILKMCNEWHWTFKNKKVIFFCIFLNIEPLHLGCEAKNIPGYVLKTVFKVGTKNDNPSAKPQMNRLDFGEHK